MDVSSKFHPIEITTHNIYFHEDSPILSCDNFDGLLATSGFDGVIRIWKINFQIKSYKENCYKTAANSSISIEHFRDLSGFSRPINCIRFYKGVELKHNGDFLIAGSSDGGKIVVFDGSKKACIREADGDDCYEIAWAQDSLIAAFSSGKIEIYSLNLITYEENKMKVDFSVHIEKIHEATIQGISCVNHLIATHSLDKSVKVHQINNGSIVLISTVTESIDSSRGLFKRLLLIDDLLFVFSKGNCLMVYRAPFGEENLIKKIGPLNSSIVKVIKSDNILYICTKKSVYILEDDLTVCCVDNACYMAITDAFLYNNTLFISSMDGFIASVRCGMK